MDFNSYFCFDRGSDTLRITKVRNNREPGENPGQYPLL